MVVRESTNVTLVCKATGYPEPYVMWRREDGEDFNYNGETGKNIKPAQMLKNARGYVGCIFKKQKFRIENHLLFRGFVFFQCISMTFC